MDVDLLTNEIATNNSNLISCDCTLFYENPWFEESHVWKLRTHFNTKWLIFHHNSHRATHYYFHDLIIEWAKDLSTIITL